jgi:hypothetical protein
MTSSGQKQQSRHHRHDVRNPSYRYRRINSFLQACPILNLFKIASAFPSARPIILHRNDDPIGMRLPQFKTYTDKPNAYPFTVQGFDTIALPEHGPIRHRRMKMVSYCVNCATERAEQKDMADSGNIGRPV